MNEDWIMMSGLKEYTIIYRGKIMGLVFAKNTSMAKELADIQFGTSIKALQADYNRDEFVVEETGSSIRSK